MAKSYSTNDLLNALAAASRVLSERKDEINRLNVFPVPDGDTGTNMALTLETVVDHVCALPIGVFDSDIRKAITTGALMGARGNSGVITSQILRGLCEGSNGYDHLSSESIDAAFSRAQEVAFQAVRKPVEGTILTVLKDCATAAKRARKKKLSCDETLGMLVGEAYASVQRTPDLLAVLKENGVVDAGGFGLAIFFDAFVAALTGKQGPLLDELAYARSDTPKVEIEQINDWEGSAYLYCTEFLVHSSSLDTASAREFLSTQGDCDLLVGTHPHFKVHVHTNRPDEVLSWFFVHDAQVSEVHIHNMKLQSAARIDALAAEKDKEVKEVGFVSVAAGKGNEEILKSLGVDEVVCGGQSMNPSTKDLLDAAQRVNARSIIFLPNNKNILLAAQSACELASVPCAVVPTRSVPEAFAALFAFSEGVTLAENVELMTEAYTQVRTGEVTTAVKDARDAHNKPIRCGDVIGIAQGSIEVVGSSVVGVVMDLLKAMDAKKCDTLTLLAGDDMDEQLFEKLIGNIKKKYDDLEIDAHWGNQPLYPIVMSLE